MIGPHSSATICTETKKQRGRKGGSGEKRGEREGKGSKPKERSALAHGSKKRGKPSILGIEKGKDTETKGKLFSRTTQD